MIVNPGIRRFLGSAIQRLFNSASFYAPLTHSLVLERGTGSPTFTRATTSTWPNNDGYMVTGVAGEIGFVGARRVDNLIRLGAAQSSTLAIAANVTMTLPAGAYQFSMGAGTGTATFSGTGGATGTLAASASGRVFVAKTITAGTLIVTGSAAILNDIQVVSMVAETDQTTIREYVSVGVPSDWAGDELVTNGTFATDTTGWSTAVGATLSIDTARLKITNDGTGANAGEARQTLTTVVGTKYVLAATGTTGSAQASIKVGTSAGAQDLLTNSLCNGFNTYTFTATSTTSHLTLRVNTVAAGAHVFFDNISVKPAYYHGSFVDGVKCFPIDLAGNALTTMLGYSAEGARTNLCLQSNAFTTTWTEIFGSCAATQNVIGPDGATSAWTLTDDNAAGTEGKIQTITLTAAAYTFSVRIKKTTGAQGNYPVIYAYTGAATPIALATIDTSNGVATAWTSFTGSAIASGVSARCRSFSTDYWLAELTFTATAAVWTVGLVPATTSVATYAGPDFTAALTGSAVFYGAQVELGSSATPYIPTTTIAVARNADVDQYPTTAGPIAAAGAISLDFTPYHAPSGTIALWGTYVDASNYTAILHDATNLIFRKRIAGSNYDATIANAFVSGTTYKVAATWGAAGTAIYLDGVAGTPHANTTAAQIAATMQVGADGNSLQQPGAGTTNLRIWQRQLSSPEGVAVTA